MTNAKLLFELLLWCNAYKIYKIDWEYSAECFWITVREIWRACLRQDGNDYSLKNSNIQYLYTKLYYTILYIKLYLYTKYLNYIYKLNYTLKILKLRIVYQIFQIVNHLFCIHLITRKKMNSEMILTNIHMINTTNTLVYSKNCLCLRVRFF